VIIKPYKKAWRRLSWVYGKIVNAIAVAGILAPAELWGVFGGMFESVLGWADVLSANALRRRAGLPSAALLGEESATFDEIVAANFWIFEQRRITLPLIEASAQRMIEDEQRYLAAHQRAIRKRKIENEPYIPAWRLERMQRSYISSMAHVSEQVQLETPLINDAFPFAYYQTRDDARVRPTHAAMHGFFALRSWEGWPKARPPCGFSCRCVCKEIARFQAIQRGWMSKSGTVLIPLRWPTSAAEANWNNGRFPDVGWEGPKLWVPPRRIERVAAA